MEPIVTLSDVPVAALRRIVKGFTAADLVNTALVCKSWSQLLNLEDLWHEIATGDHGPALELLPGCTSWRQSYRLLSSLGLFATGWREGRAGPGSPIEPLTHHGKLCLGLEPSLVRYCAEFTPPEHPTAKPEDEESTAAGSSSGGDSGDSSGGSGSSTQAPGGSAAAGEAGLSSAATADVESDRDEASDEDVSIESEPDGEQERRRWRLERYEEYVHSTAGFPVHGLRSISCNSVEATFMVGFGGVTAGGDLLLWVGLLPLHPMAPRRHMCRQPFEGANWWLMPEVPCQGRVESVHLGRNAAIVITNEGALWRAPYHGQHGCSFPHIHFKQLHAGHAGLGRTVSACSADPVLFNSVQAQVEAALNSDGQVHVWGWTDGADLVDQMGQGEFDWYPAALEGLWGQGYPPAVPDSDLWHEGRYVKKPLRVLGALAERRVTSLAAGSHHFAAAASDGSVVCWGSNHAGQCGLSASRPTACSSPVVVQSMAGRGAVAVACGHHHTAALTAHGKVFVWGSCQPVNNGPDLRASATTLRELLVAGKGEGTPVSISAACWATAVVTESGATFVFGGLRDPTGAGTRVLAGGDMGPERAVLAVAVGGKTDSCPSFGPPYEFLLAAAAAGPSSSSDNKDGSTGSESAVAAGAGTGAGAAGASPSSQQVAAAARAQLAAFLKQPLQPAPVLPPPQQACGWCGAAGQSRCSRCKAQMYCCREHQAAHWAEHKRKCVQAS